MDKKYGILMPCWLKYKLSLATFEGFWQYLVEHMGSLPGDTNGKESAC